MLRQLALTCAAAVVFVAHAPQVQAADITGVWADNVRSCNKIFVKKGNSVSFAKDADLYGSGFIIEGDRIRGKMASCAIKARKEVGDLVHMVASCATEISIGSNQFTVKILGPDSVARVFPDMPELETKYERCRL